MKLQKGDYVLTEGMDEDTYHKVAKAFMEAGAGGSEWEFDDPSYWKAAGWDESDLFQCWNNIGRHFAGGRQLTIAQVLGEDGPAMPAIGTFWEDPDNPGYTVEVVGYHNGEIICCDAKGWYSPYGVSELTVPAKSERDKAVEEMLEEMHDVVMHTTPRGHITPATAKLLYDAGYRKVES